MKPDKSNIENWVKESIADNSDLFVLNITVSPANDIVITLDGDHGVSMGECVQVSRYVESRLNEDEEANFSLKVESPDITQPIVHPRQYNKNIGRSLVITTTEGDKLEGKLDKIENEKLYLSYKTREPKPVGKGKHTVSKQHIIPIQQIEQAKVKIVFN